MSDLIPFLVHRTLAAKASGVTPNKLTLRGPIGFEQRIGTLFSVYCADPVRDPGMVVEEMQDSVPFAINGCGANMRMIPVRHIPGHESVAYEVVLSGRSFLYAGDACDPLDAQPKLFQESLDCHTILLSAGAVETAGGHIDVNTAISWIGVTGRLVMRRLILNHVPEQCFQAAQDCARSATTSGRLQVIIARDGDGYDL